MFIELLTNTGAKLTIRKEDIVSFSEYVNGQPKVLKEGWLKINSIVTIMIPGILYDYHKDTKTETKTTTYYLNTPYSELKVLVF